MTFDKRIPALNNGFTVQERRWIGPFLAKRPTSHPPNESTALRPYERLAGPPSGALLVWARAESASLTLQNRTHGRSVGRFVPALDGAGPRASPTG